MNRDEAICTEVCVYLYVYEKLVAISTIAPFPRISLSDLKYNLLTERNDKVDTNKTKQNKTKQTKNKTNKKQKQTNKMSGDRGEIICSVTDWYYWCLHC
jgi:hypothetical protein